MNVPINYLRSVCRMIPLLVRKLKDRRDQPPEGNSSSVDSFHSVNESGENGEIAAVARESGSAQDTPMEVVISDSEKEEESEIESISSEEDLSELELIRDGGGRNKSLEEFLSKSTK